MSSLLVAASAASSDLAQFAVVAAPYDVPDVGGGSAPPGAGGLLTVLKWVAWTVTVLCVAGIFGVAARMAVDHGRGGGREHVRGLAFVLGACVLVGSASGVVGALI